MHPNPSFRQTEAARTLAFVRARSFGTLILSGAEHPLISHVPFLLNDAADQADLHLLRSNPIARALRSGPQRATLAVTGPDSYISPDWYGAEDQVPTWNYVAVHMIGRIEALPQEELHALLDRQSAHFETQLAPKPQWTSAKLSEGVMERMMRSIAPFRFHITKIDSTWKLGQNKPDEVRQMAAQHVMTDGIGSQIADLGDLMRQPPPEEG